MVNLYAQANLNVRKKIPIPNGDRNVGMPQTA
jgi:hypothetical protein